MQKVEAHRDEIRKYGVKKLALVGSYAREEADESSDIDFLVQFKQGRGLFDDYTGLKRLLEDTLNRNVDLIKQKLVRQELKKSILEGKKIETKV